MEEYKTITEEEVKVWCDGGFLSSLELSFLTEIINGKYSLEVAREDVLSFRPKK